MNEIRNDLEKSIHETYNPYVKRGKELNCDEEIIRKLYAKSWSEYDLERAKTMNKHDLEMFSKTKTLCLVL